MCYLMNDFGSWVEKGFKKIEDLLDKRDITKINGAASLMEETPLLIVRSIFYSNAVYLRIAPANKFTPKIARLHRRLSVTLPYEEALLVQLVRLKDTKDGQVISRWRAHLKIFCL
jgi:hypothetical protein